MVLSYTLMQMTIDLLYTAKDEDTRTSTESVEQCVEAINGMDVG